MNDDKKSHKQYHVLTRLFNFAYYLKQFITSLLFVLYFFVVIYFLSGFIYIYIYINNTEVIILSQQASNTVRTNRCPVFIFTGCFRNSCVAFSRQ